MLDRREQAGIQSCQMSQLLGVEPAVLAPLAVDEPQLSGIGNQHLVAAVLKQPAYPQGE